MRKKQMLLTVLFLGTGLFISGCIAAAAVGAGTAAYVMGKMQGTEAKDIDTVYNAAEKAAEQLKLNITERTHDKMSGEIIAWDSQDKKITIKLKAATENVTDIAIRVGFFGDETKSQLIYEKIRENLKK
jgi:hypothetical protein